MEAIIPKENRPKRRRVGILRGKVKVDPANKRMRQAKLEEAPVDKSIASVKLSPAMRALEEEAKAQSHASASESPRMKRFAPALCALVSAVSAAESPGLQLDEEPDAVEAAL